MNDLYNQEDYPKKITRKATMKIQGKQYREPNVEYCYIPRGDEVIVFKCKAVLDMDEFDKICKPPKPPQKRVKGGKVVDDLESPRHTLAMEGYAKRRMSYMILKSLEETEGLEWENVAMGDPDSWNNYEKEFKESGFSEIEVMRIVNSVSTANCLNETKLEEARTRFLLSQSEKEEAGSSLREEQVST